MKHMTINTYLAEGTRITSKNYRGTVLASIEGRDQFGCPILSYKIRLTEKIKIGIANTIKYVECNPIIKIVGYTGIRIA